MRQIKYIIFIFLSLTIFSCEQKPQENTKLDPEVPQIQTNDANLIKKYKKPFADFLFARKNLITTELYDENNINDYAHLGQLLKDDQILNRVYKLNNSYLSNNQFTQVAINESIYIKLVKQQSEQALSSGIDDAEKDVLRGVETVKTIVISNNTPLKKITISYKLQDQLTIARQFIHAILEDISAASINTDLKTQIIDSLKKQSESSLAQPELLDKQLLAAKTLTQAVQILKQYIDSNQTILTPEDQLSLKNAEKLGTLVDQMNDEKNALQALAMAWSMLTAEERLQNFKSANEKLYDFLQKKSDSEIQCLINGDCDGFFKKLILKFGVYPAIKDYGVDNIKQTLTDKSLSQVNDNVQNQAFLTISVLDTNINQQITEQVQQSLKQLNEFKNEFANQIATGLGAKINANSLKMFLSNKSFDFSREFTIATNQAMLLKDNDPITQVQLVEKLLQFMNTGTDYQKNSFIDSIKESLQAANPRFYINQNKSNESKINVKDQASALLFYSQMLKQLSDWRNTPYDIGITEYKAQDFITLFQSPELNRLLFQKSELVGMALSLSAQVLKQIESEQSVIYLLDNNNQRISIKDYLNDASSSPLVHSAASDFKNGLRTDSTELSDLCMLIQAYSEYYSATENIQLSKSESLKNSDLQNQVINSRRQIKLLILTLANFISNQLINDDKTLNASLNFQTGEKTKSLNSLDYAYAINALKIAFDITGIDIYKMSALELYYSLNKLYYSDSSRFYQTQLGQQNTKTHQDFLIKMFINTHPLRSVMDLTSQMQFDRIYENWLSQF